MWWFYFDCTNKYIVGANAEKLEGEDLFKDPFNRYHTFINSIVCLIILDNDTNLHVLVDTIGGTWAGDLHPMLCISHILSPTLFIIRKMLN